MWVLVVGGGVRRGEGELYVGGGGGEGCVWVAFLSLSLMWSHEAVKVTIKTPEYNSLLGLNLCGRRKFLLAPLFSSFHFSFLHISSASINACT